MRLVRPAARIVILALPSPTCSKAKWFEGRRRPRKTYAVGEMWMETPNQLHAVSRNGSDSKPARLLAILLTEKGAQPRRQRIRPVIVRGSSRDHQHKQQEDRMRLPVWSIWQDVRFGARMLMRDRGFHARRRPSARPRLGAQHDGLHDRHRHELYASPVDRAIRSCKSTRGSWADCSANVYIARGLPRSRRDYAHVRGPRRVCVGGTMTIGDEHQAAERLADRLATGKRVSTPACDARVIGRHFSEEDDRLGRAACGDSRGRRLARALAAPTDR